MMDTTSNPFVLGLFADRRAAAAAARDLRALGIPREAVSIVARSHDEEGELARESGGSPGSEIEDSQPASALGELSGHVLAAMALVLPGIGPIVADGPLAAELAEAAGHLAGGIARTLVQTGLDPDTAREWEALIGGGHVLVAGHVDGEGADAAREAIARHGATHLVVGRWPR